MSGCSAYKVIPSEYFARSYKNVIARHYGRPEDEAARQHFLDIVAQYLAELRTTARPSDSEAEPWPNRQPSNAVSGFESRKIRFQMPQLSGSASKGRLIYLVSEANCFVEPIWLYTHDEFDARPPDRDLRDAFRDAMDVAAKFLEGNPNVRVKRSDGTEAEVRIKIERTK